MESADKLIRLEAELTYRTGRLAAEIEALKAQVTLLQKTVALLLEDKKKAN